MEYDENEVLTKYVWEHYDYLMTDFERKVGQALQAREKAQASSSPRIAALIYERWGMIGDPDVEAALSEGEEAFRHGVRERLLAEQQDAIYINRCPNCHRIARTPDARYCFWCAADA